MAKLLKGSFGKNKGRTQDRSRKSEKRGNKSGVSRNHRR